MIHTPPPAELLLGRAEFAGDLGEAASFVRGRRVLVTGAAGSVGWPLTLRLVAARPDELTVIDHHEHSLFTLERTLTRESTRLQVELMDVRDSRRLERIFQERRPEIVFHLAAAKHVPYGERFPEGAVTANALATRDLLDLADRVGTEIVVYPSSDKSVQPPSVYGATKRLAEALVQSRANGRHWAVVRYVNIIGTRGSVIETFTQQVLEDRPLSVTDDRMTRYWISMDEAIWCALNTARCAGSGDVVMPECGDPVPLTDTARRLAGWYRPGQVPYPIACTGIRPGERLHEILLSPNESFATDPPPAPGLRSVRSMRHPAALAHVDEVLTELERLVDVGDRQLLSTACLEAAEALQ